MQDDQEQRLEQEQCQHTYDRQRQDFLAVAVRHEQDRDDCEQGREQEFHCVCPGRRNDHAIVFDVGQQCRCDLRMRDELA